MKHFHVMMTETRTVTRSRVFVAATEDEARDEARATWGGEGWGDEVIETDTEIMDCEDVTPVPAIHPDLLEMADQCRKIFEEAQAQHEDLWGHSVLDLCADNVRGTLDELRRAIIISNIYLTANDRIKSQIEQYFRPEHD